MRSSRSCFANEGKSRIAATSDSEIISRAAVPLFSRFLRTSSFEESIHYRHRTMKSRSSLLLALVVYVQIVLSQWKCDYRLYGRPPLDDCAKALLTLPEASAKFPSSRLDDPRKFVEPQYLEPPFGECPTNLSAMEVNIFKTFIACFIP